MGVGRRLLPCLQLHPRPVRDVVPRPAAGACLGAEDVPMVEDEAACDLPDLTLGGGDPKPSLGGGSVEGVPGRVRLPATHIKHLDYVHYRRNHLPIGSGVTEAACKTVFSQRLKRSGMAWSVAGGQRIVDLRVIHLSGVWSQVQLIVPPIEETSRGADSAT